MTNIPAILTRDAALADAHIREGRFQRSLSLLAGLSSILAGLEVSYEHYRGSYGQRIMWTPVALSGAMTGAGVAGAVSPRTGRRVLRWVSFVTLADGLIGFLYHIRGIARKPGGWRETVANIIMGPPIFAPLLFGVSAYLGLIASYLRTEEESEFSLSTLLDVTKLPVSRQWQCQLRMGRYQKHLAVATILGAFFSGFEALYSHYKNNFRYAAQWTPVIIAPALMAVAGASIRSPRIARTWLPALSLLAIADGAIGFGYHVRGVLRRPGGIKKPLYNTIYGPPIFAPLLFAACGALGLLAALMRREK
ncbi:MAG TPA: hypothetical protein VHY22_15760 [Chthoniobacteraceae bacterium]|jgi:hypothetical protein|nr:hypothetical protein [Chthoniobacteraceae bacterium]